MRSPRLSYWKTVIPAGLASVSPPILAGLAVPAPGRVRSLALALGYVTAIPPLLVVVAGLIVLTREAAARRARDLFQALNEPRSERAIAAGRLDAGLRLRAALRTVLGTPRLVVGDEVEIRSLDEIRGTLDDHDSLDGLPFMPEMARFCGRRARVVRRVDKIYDYGRSKVVRRLTGTVLLHGLRCDGSAHGGCQARCAVLWKEAWLRPVAAAPAPAATPPEPWPGRPQAAQDAGGSTVYRCQFTDLAAATTPLRRADPRQDLRPLLAGNVTAGAFGVAVLTRLFNGVQAWRGGTAFPAMGTGDQAATPVIDHGLRAGDTVQVREAEAIFQTLDRNSRNRGMWFDRDMLKHCGHRHEVLARVDRIIDDATGRMRTMKTPCIILKDVTYSGEYLRFCPQEEYLYWREAWLAPAVDPTRRPLSDAVGNG